MTWADLYLICFLVGFLLSALSFLFGTIHIHVPHLPHFHFHGHFHGPASSNGHGGISHSHGDTTGHEVSYFNFGTVSGFLAWFGGTGYLLARYSALSFFLALGISFMSGLGGAAIIFLFLAKVLAPHDKFLDPADYDMIGVLGTVTSRLRPEGTGEMIYSRDGARRAVPIRSEAGEEIAKGIEVVVTRYEKGIAYVRRWEELTNTADTRS
jgi:membrane protein implicated in regulation of membrane protease activity